MFMQLPSASWTPPHNCWVSSHLCLHRIRKYGRGQNFWSNGNSGRPFSGLKFYCRRWICGACLLPSDSGIHKLNSEFDKLAKKSLKAQKLFVVRRSSNELDSKERVQESIQTVSNSTNFEEDPLVDKLRDQLGELHPIPSPPSNRNVGGLLVFFFLFGVIFDKVLLLKKKSKSVHDAQPVTKAQVPTRFSLFLEKDLQRKESVEWVNMVLGKLWKVYRVGIENWIIGLLQPVIDNLKKPDYVQKVEIKQFSLGEEPLSVRNVERRTSRRANDLQYQIGLRYTGGACMLLFLSLKFGIIPIVLPVGVRDFDIDGELWVRLRLIPSEPWVGAVSWAFVSLPKIKIVLSPFRLFNLMAIPVLSMFLTKLLTVDLPQLFVLPKKIALDFQKGRAVGPFLDEFRTDSIQEGNEDFVGELSVTVVDARKLPYPFYGKTDPYVVLSLGDQVYRSKRNSQTSFIGPPGEPIWNQDFLLLVANPRKQRLCIQVKDSFGVTDFTIGREEVDLGQLKDTVPTDRIITLQGGWGVFRNDYSGEILLRLTYKAYVEDDEDDEMEEEPLDGDLSDDGGTGSDTAETTYEQKQRDFSDGTEKESLIDELAALLLSEEFQGIVSSETGNTKNSEEAMNSASKVSSDHSAELVSADSESSAEDPGGSALLWFAVITVIVVLISMSMEGSSLFNP